MLRARGGTPVLIDFGAARQYVGRASRPLTEVLTPGYAPFEQYRSKGHQGPWTDIYALGALAYTSLSGKVPDEAPDRVADDRLPSIGRMVPGLSRELTAAVDAALAVAERDRPQDVENGWACCCLRLLLLLPRRRRRLLHPHRQRRGTGAW